MSNNFQMTGTLEKQSFVTLSKNSDVEATVELERQLVCHQSSVEAAIRALANISSTLTTTKQEPDQGR